MKIDVTMLSDAELLQLIAAAAAELQARRNAANPVIERRPASEPEIIIVNEPNRTDQALAHRIVGLLKRNGFVLSVERDQYREIVGKFPEWAKSQRLPSDVGGSVARHWLRLYGK